MEPNLQEYGNKELKLRIKDDEIYYKHFLIYKIFKNKLNIIEQEIKKISIFSFQKFISFFQIFI